MDSERVAFGWQDVDQALAGLMLNELANEFHNLLRHDEQRIEAENRKNLNVYAVPSQFIAVQLQRTEEWANRAYAVWRDVCRRQGTIPSPPLLRAIYRHGVIPLIGARRSSITAWLQITAKRTNLHSSEWLKAALKELQLNMRRLSDRVKRRIEIDAKTAEYDRGSAPDLLNLTVGLQSPDPIDGNPFAKATPRHRVWVDESRRAEEAVHRLNTALIRAKRELPLASNPDEAQKIVIGQFGFLVTSKFDIWAKRGVTVIWDDDEIGSFDRWLENYANEWLKSVKAFFPAPIETNWLIRQLRLLLVERIEYWKSEARRYVSEQKIHIAQMQSGVADDKHRAQHSPKRRKLASTQSKKLGVIFGALQLNLKGPRYCKHLQENGLLTPSDWQLEGCPRSYVEAYRNQGWRKRIQDQKHRALLRFHELSNGQREQIIQRFARASK